MSALQLDEGLSHLEQESYVICCLQPVVAAHCQCCIVREAGHCCWSFNYVHAFRLRPTSMLSNAAVLCSLHHTDRVASSTNRSALNRVLVQLGESEKEKGCNANYDL